MRVDWDRYRSHRVTRSRRIPRRSTLVLIRDGKEVGRLVAATGKDTIKALLDKGL
jgi:thioredoxin